MSKLYEITAEIRELQSFVDSDELSIDQISDTMCSLSCEFSEKIEACLKVRQSALSDSAAIDREIERLEKLKKPYENSAKSLSDYVKMNMLSSGIDKIKTGLFAVTLRKPVKKLGSLDESAIPDKYFTEVPATKKLDKRLLLSDAKLSQIEGVEIVESDRSLIIK